MNVMRSVGNKLDMIVIEYRKHAGPVVGVVCIVLAVTVMLNTLTAVYNNILLNGNNYGELRLAELRGDLRKRNAKVSGRKS